LLPAHSSLLFAPCSLLQKDEERGGMRIWTDDDGKLWTLADSGIDTEMFELIGEPIYDDASELWYQEIQLRSD
jgi:hypothetical protein